MNHDQANAAPRQSAPKDVRRQLALTTALLSAGVIGYGGRAAYAGSCTGSGGTYTCTGGAAYGSDVTQTLSGTPLTVTVADGFGIWTGSSNGFTLSGTGGVSFTDDYGARISGKRDAIYARNDDSGALSVTTTGDVTGTIGFGIYARNYGTDLTIAAAFVRGGDAGIQARDSGSGELSVTAKEVRSEYHHGIDASKNRGTDLTITTGIVRAEGHGIHATNRASGALTVTATEASGSYGLDPTGKPNPNHNGILGYSGIAALNYGTDLTIAADSAGGYYQGVKANNRGSGALSVTVGSVYSYSRPDKSILIPRIAAIYALNYGTDLTIDADSVLGSYFGITAYNRGNGALKVKSTGVVDGINQDGIFAVNKGTDLTITLGNVRGYERGIDADNNGSGALSVTATGVVEGYKQDGIFAVNKGTDLTITLGNVRGYERGIHADNNGSGALSVTATGAVRGTLGDGINARNDASGTDLTIAAVDVTGGDMGIYARNYGSGALSVTATGTVIGATDGIHARNSGSGALNVTTTGTVSGNKGINARNDASGTDLTIAAADVTGGDTGIVARNYGSGALRVTATGTASGTTAGIYAQNSSTRSTDLTIAAASVTSDRHGIDARNYGSGALRVTATDAVSGTGGFGIAARNRYGTDLTVSAADVTGGNDGIYARNSGSGALSVTATGAVSGNLGYGIHARNSGTDLTIAAADVTGSRSGIFALHSGSGALSVTATGAVRGGSGAGITAFTTAGKTATITLNDGASVSAASGVAITDNVANSTVTVNTGASVTGAIRLGDGRDSLNFDGGDFSGVTAFDGGGGAEDALRFGDGAAGVLDGDLVTGFETVHFGAGSAVSVFDALIADVFVEAGGALGPGASPGTLFVDGAFDTMAGATLSFELGGLTPGTGYDVLDVAGTASLADATMFEILGFGGFLPTIGNSFDILIADDIFLSSLSNLTFDFDIGGSWSFGIFDVGGREALRLEAIAPPVAPVPVPPALAMFGSGLVGLFGLGWARRRNQRPAA